MKMAKKFKILSILLTFALVMVACVMLIGGVNVAPVSAGPVPSSYFSYDSDRIADENAISFENNNAVIKLTNNESVNFTNKLVIDEFEVNLTVPAGVDAFTLTASVNSFDPNGNLDAEGKYVKTIENVLVIDIVNGTAKLNDGTAISVTYTKNADNGVDLVIGLSEQDNFVTATVQGTVVTQTGDKFYKVASKDKTIASIKLAITTAQTGDLSVALKTVSQKAGDPLYTQTFELLPDNSKFITVRPRVSIDDKFLGDGSTGDTILVAKGMFYSLTYTPYSFTGEYRVSNLEHTTEDATVFVNQNSTNNICFTGAIDSTATFRISGKDKENVHYETYTAKVVEDNVAPVYVNNEDAIKAFTNEIKDRLFDEEKNSYVRLGSNQYLELPSFDNFVSEDVTSFENLKYTVYYMLPSSTSASTTTNLKIPLTEAGTYWFYVVFGDQMGNSMDKDLFKIDIDDPTNNGEYAKYIFEFSIEDDYPISVTPAMKYDSGYKDVKYTASAFDIDASGTGYTANYKLMYKIGNTGTEDDWIELPRASKVDSLSDNQLLRLEEYGFTKDELKEISYDGNLTFTPTKKGVYKIACSVTPTVTSQRAELLAETAEITIDKDKVTVAPANNWFSDNLWSIIFLSVGTLCLAGIIALLVIKPKDRADKE